MPVTDVPGNREPRDLTVAEVVREGGDAVCLGLAVPPELRERFSFRPGQYVTLCATVGGEALRRPYSICSVPGGPTLQVGVRQVADGRFSRFVAGLRPGDRLAVMPPEGRFTAETGAGTTGGPMRCLLIAAGSGITPVVSIAESGLAGHAQNEVTLVYGNRDTAHIMFRERLADLKDRFMGRCTLIHVLSREPQDVELMQGRIDGAKLRALTAAGLIDPTGADAVLLCGPDTMIATAEATLGALGVAPERIRAERFLPADGQALRPIKSPAPAAPARGAEARGAEAGLEVATILDGRRRVYRHGDPGQAVLYGARAAGIELPYSCAGGMCCTCRCRIVEGSAEMAVNYSLQKWEIAAGFTLACQAHPTSERLVLDFDAV